MRGSSSSIHEAFARQQAQAAKDREAPQSSDKLVEALVHAETDTDRMITVMVGRQKISVKEGQVLAAYASTHKRFGGDFKMLHAVSQLPPRETWFRAGYEAIVPAIKRQYTFAGA